jgi:hypothetical protein
MLTAAIYTRFSSELQRATSIVDQERVCRDTARRLGCVVLDDHVYADEELSGAVGQRAGYQRLLVAARARAFDVILVESQDRLWRNQGEMHHALERLTFCHAAGDRAPTQRRKCDSATRGTQPARRILDTRDHRRIDAASARHPQQPALRRAHRLESEPEGAGSGQRQASLAGTASSGVGLD